MAVRRREKPLTPAEALDKTKKQLLPFWVGSEPLLAGVRQANGVRAFPLDSRMIDRPWMLIFIDPFAISSRDLLKYVEQWVARYDQQKFSVLQILQLPYSFARDNEWVHREVSFQHQNSAAVLDNQGLLGEAFSVSVRPRMIVMSAGKVHIDKSGKDWCDGSEALLQLLFRSTDPGLALFPVLQAPSKLYTDLPGVDFVGLTENQTSVKIPGATQVELSGNWIRTPDRIITFDPKAELCFDSPGQAVGIVAHGVQKDMAGSYLNYDDSEIQVNLTRDMPTDHPIQAEDLKVDSGGGALLVDSGIKRRGSCQVKLPKVYYLFNALPTTHRKVTLKFPSSDKTGVGIYGLRFAN